jgi:hypothetical protein
MARQNIKINFPFTSRDFKLLLKDVKNIKTDNTLYSKRFEKLLADMLIHLTTIANTNSSISRNIIPPGTGGAGTPASPGSGGTTGHGSGGLGGGGQGHQSLLSMVLNKTLGIKGLSWAALIFKTLDAVHDIDKLQKESLKLGTNISNIYKSSMDMINDLPLSFEQAIGIKMDLLTEGFKINNKAVFNLGSVMKATGQDTKVLAASVVKQSLIGGMTNTQLSKFADSIVDNSRRYNIAADDLIGAMNSLEESFRPFDLANMGPTARLGMGNLISEGFATRSELGEILRTLTSQKGEQAALRFFPQEWGTLQNTNDPGAWAEAMRSALGKLNNQLVNIGQIGGGRRFAVQQAMLENMGLGGFDRVRAIMRDRKQQQEGVGSVGSDSQYWKTLSQTFERTVNAGFQRVALESATIANPINYVNSTTKDNMNYINGNPDKESVELLRGIQGLQKKTVEGIEKINSRGSIPEKGNEQK